METLNNIQIIIGIIATLTTGGIVGWFVGFRYLKTREQAKAKQEVEQAEGLELTNTRELINLYKQALSDVKSLSKQTETEYADRVKQYEKRLEELSCKLSVYETNFKEQEATIDNLTRSQLKLKLEIMSVKNQSISNCSDCSFIDTCEKYKAKKSDI